MDLYLQFEETRKQVENNPIEHNHEGQSLHLDFLNQLTAVAENHLQDHFKEWENAALVKEFLKYAQPLAEVRYESKQLLNLSERLADTFEEHPRLKVAFCQFQLHLLELQEINDTSVQELKKQLNAEIRDYQKNISLADAGELDKIASTGFFNTDPVEWTEQWENCIDNVYQQLEEKQGEDAFPTGFCHQYWEAKAKVLKTYGIDWKSPEVMNPDLDFE